MTRTRPSLVRTLFVAMALLSVASLAFSTWQGLLALREGWNLTLIGATAAPLAWRLVQTAAAGLGAALLLAGWLSLRLRRELRELRQGADRLASGHLGHRLPLHRHHRELAEVADSLNRLAATLAHHISSLEGHSREQSALLAGMREGVLALDHHGRLRICNRAAGELLALGSHPVGALLDELLTAGGEVGAFFQQAWKHPEGWERQIVLSKGLELRIWTQVQQAAGGEALLLGVITDMSAANQAEHVRRDFVSNVSHELKTPVTSIRGYVESLQDGAGDVPELRKRFLEVIERQSRRLDAIIDDLLELSRIERREEERAIQREAVELEPFLRHLLDDHAPLAQAKALELRLQLDSGLPPRVWLEKALFERALVNLLSNAIRYGGMNSWVDLLVRREEEQLLVEVRDQGVGIAPEHLPRLFERFYVVDKARSRSLGGTGLGLSIVKHAIQAQGGQVGVESAPGSGSTFWLRLPLDSQDAERRGRQVEASTWQRP